MHRPQLGWTIMPYRSEPFAQSPAPDSNPPLRNDAARGGRVTPGARREPRVLTRLSKSRYVAGLKCPKLLWWSTYEPDAQELQADPRLHAVFERGHQVGELARTYVPGGVLIDLPYWEVEQRVAATERAIDEGAAVIYEASFLADGIFVAIDILERVRGGYVLVEVKATLDVKDAHLPDVAVQVYVASVAGLKIRRAEVMHLNRECEHPDLSKLFVRADVTADIAAMLDDVPATAASLRAVLQGPLPDTEPGEHCDSPYPCAFLERCRPAVPQHHVSTLYRIQRKRVTQLEARGITMLGQLPPEEVSAGPARRQVESVRTRGTIVEAGLRQALRGFELPIAFLDFETINPPVPAWRGCSPYQQVAVQMSCHVLAADGFTHHEWLGRHAEDPRRPLARAVLTACRGARTVLAYNASFERARIAELAIALPELRNELEALALRIRDLLGVVRDHVYQPDFGGSFSLKAVLPALVPGLTYQTLSIGSGQDAAIHLERLLLHTKRADAEQTRKDLLDYCRMDTFGMLELYSRLQSLAA